MLQTKVTHGQQENTKPGHQIEKYKTDKANYCGPRWHMGWRHPSATLASVRKVTHTWGDIVLSGSVRVLAQFGYHHSTYWWDSPMVKYGMLWYGMVWYGQVWYETATPLFPPVPFWCRIRGSTHSHLSLFSSHFKSSSKNYNLKPIHKDVLLFFGPKIRTLLENGKNGRKSSLTLSRIAAEREGCNSTRVCPMRVTDHVGVTMIIQ